MKRVIRNRLKKVFWKLPMSPSLKEKIRQSYASRKELADDNVSEESIILSDKFSVNNYMQHILSIPTAVSDQYKEYEEHIITAQKVDIIAYYLTQYHPNVQNDEWWGKGTTEWTNVSKAVPQYEAHYQPRLPGELGYYDLRIKENMKRQIELAQNYGVNVFCFYYYWFSGKRLLEMPLNMFLQDKSLDMKFCICWTNENWTRRFSGTNTDILMKVGDTKEDDISFINDVLDTLSDSRYYSISNKLVLLVYRPAMLHSVSEVLCEWKKIVKNKLGKELYLIAVQEKEDTTDWIKKGFDAETEFQPKRINNIALDITDKVCPVRHDFKGEVKDYEDIVINKKYVISSNAGRKVYPAVMPMWDNTARRNNRALVYHGATPKLYKEWLINAIHSVCDNDKLDKPVVFVNAWNEWGEGAYLEPDRFWGYAYLQSTYEALKEM
jgi:lipopolysaccharide biosynthesis protein